MANFYVHHPLKKQNKMGVKLSNLKKCKGQQNITPSAVHNSWWIMKSIEVLHLPLKKVFMLLGYWTEEIDKALNKTRTQRLINPILHLSQFTSMYASLNFRNIAMFFIISKVLIYIVSYIFCFCEVIFGSRIFVNHARWPYKHRQTLFV